MKPTADQSSMPEERRRLGGAPGVPRCKCGALGVRSCSAPHPLRNEQSAFRGVRNLSCDSPLCDACAIPVGPGREVCAEHAP